MTNEAAAAILRARLHQQLLDHVANLEQANAQIKRQQDLVVRGRQMAALGEITEAISHEIKGPLVPIGGFARAIRRDVADDTPQANMLDIVIREVNRLERVVDGVLALSRPPKPSLKPVDMPAIIEDVFSVYRADADTRQIALRADIPPDVPPPHLDDDQWHQLLLVLVADALAATPNGGTITASMRLLEDGHYRFTLADTGVGVAEEDIPKVFAALYAARPTGSSLGLNVVAQIVNLHHGRTTVESVVGEGTQIHIDIPAPQELYARMAEDAAAEGDVEPTAPLDPLTVGALKGANGADN